MESEHRNLRRCRVQPRSRRGRHRAHSIVGVSDVRVVIVTGCTPAQGAALEIGSTLIGDLTIGEDAYVAAGAVIIHGVPAESPVAAVPATVKKRT